MASSSLNTQTSTSLELPRPVANSQRRRIFSTSSHQPEAPVDGNEYFVKLRGDTPNEATHQRTTVAQPQQAVQTHNHTRNRTHSDPDTFAVFTAAEGSTFGKSDSFTFLQSLGDDAVQQEDTSIPPQGAAVDLGMDYEYSDDEDMDMNRSSFDEPLSDTEIMQLVHPLASLSS